MSATRGRGRSRGRSRGCGRAGWENVSGKEVRKPGATNSGTTGPKPGSSNPPRPGRENHAVAITPAGPEVKAPRAQSVTSLSEQEKLQYQSYDERACVDDRVCLSLDASEEDGIAHSSRTSWKGSRSSREASYTNGTKSGRECGHSNNARHTSDGQRRTKTLDQPQLSVASPLRPVASESVQAKPASVTADHSSHSDCSMETEHKSQPNAHGKQQPPTRPGYGKEGREIALNTNYFELRLPNCMTVYHCDVVIKPDKVSKGIRWKVFEQFQRQFSKVIGAYGFYDGSKIAYFTKEVKSDLERKVSYSPSAGEKSRDFTVTLRPLPAILNIGTDYLKQLCQKASVMMPTLQAVDVILRHLPSLCMQPIGRSFFSKPDKPILLGMGTEAWLGYYQSAKFGTGWKMMLNVDTVATAFHSEQSAFDFMCMVLRDSKDASRPLSREDREKFENRELTEWENTKFAKEIKDLRIEVTHLSYPRRCKVSGVTQNSVRTQTFIHECSECTVEDYFKKVYPNSCSISHPKLPCLEKGRDIYYPIDVCKIVSQKCMKKLTEAQTASMIRKTAKPAYERQQDILDVVKDAGFQSDSFQEKVCFSVSASMVDVAGRVLKPPTLMYKDGVIRPDDGKGWWNMDKHKFHRGATVTKWVMICSIWKCSKRDCAKFGRDLRNQAHVMGMDMKDYFEIEHVDRKCTMKKAFENLTEKHKGSLDLVVAIVQKRSSDYKIVKMLGDSHSGKAVATQCVQDVTVQRKCNPATLGNICLKINAKLGGSNSIVDLGTRPSMIRGIPIIIFGADVTHPRSDDSTSPSIASVVASVDLEGGKYRALHRNQKHRQEIIADLAEMAKDHLNAFCRTTGKMPDKIIFYRDGVSDGQFDAVRLEEIAALQRACMEIKAGYQPEITFLVVQKRHHTRFFPKDRRDASGKGRNVPPGTLVDRTITHPTQFDFYLCSHAAIQGTSRPCHYHVLWDDTDFTADQLQCFTYQLCHMFWRCNRSVSYPAPTYYAHHDAAHARMLLQAAADTGSRAESSSSGGSGLLTNDDAIKIHESRKDKMYFI